MKVRLSGYFAIFRDVETCVFIKKSLTCHCPSPGKAALFDCQVNFCSVLSPLPGLGMVALRIIGLETTAPPTPTAVRL